MKSLRLDPFLYSDECEEHGKNVPFIVEPQTINFKEKNVYFVFYCKKCYHKYGVNASAWRSTVTFEQYNELFGNKIYPDN